jgi:hypothetical protein
LRGKVAKAEKKTPDNGNFRNALLASSVSATHTLIKYPLVGGAALLPEVKWGTSGWRVRIKCRSARGYLAEAQRCSDVELREG